jgi:serine/threonine kinase 16
MSASFPAHTWHSNRRFAAVSRTIYTNMIASLIATWHWLVAFLHSMFLRYAGPVILLDTGRKVRLGRQIAEGGFSFVFEATDAQDTSSPDVVHRYALKRIRCGDTEILESCRHEARVHRAIRHPNVMPLLGMAITVDRQNRDASLCYMLFPYYPWSLRQQVNQRVFHSKSRRPDVAPWKELDVLEIVYGIVHGTRALHEAGFSHRDIKPENVLLPENRTSRSFSSKENTWQPVLMDFGSAGPLRQSLRNRNDVLMLAENASMHTTMPYRPPELLEGAVRVGDEDIDFAAVDVWSVGCTLFAILFGASPLESEFNQRDGSLRVVDCTQLSILKPVPMPPLQLSCGSWYSADILTLVVDMLVQDRHARPTLATVTSRLEQLIESKGGKVPISYDSSPYVDNDNVDDNDGVALIQGNHSFV